MSALLIDTKNRVRFITLNRAERHNAFDDALIAELTGAFEAASADPDVRVVVLDSLGKSFSAGADLEWMKRMAGYDRARNLEDSKALARLMQVIDQCPKPTIAVVQGAAYGGGVGLAACCDMVAAADHAVFCLSEVKLGIIPAVISPYVVRAIGGRASRRYFQTAETFSAAKAAELGLVSEVTDTEGLAEVRDRWINHLLVNGPKAMRAAKDLAVQASERALNDDLRAWTAERIADLRASDEGKEGIGAFLERRKPSWI
jgi:methylglutaconyl-CoA hydratase